MTWYENVGWIVDDGTGGARHRFARRPTVSRQPSSQRSKAMRRGAMMLVAGILVPVAVIIVHLTNLDDAAGPNGTVSADRQDHLWAEAPDLPPVPTTDPTDLITPRSAPPSPGSTATSTSPVRKTSPPALAGGAPPVAVPPQTTPPAVQPLLIDDFNGSPGWTDGSGHNDLGKATDCEVFVSCTVSGGALVLAYDDDGWFGSHIDRGVVGYTHLVLRIRGAHGGEEDDIRLTLGGVRSQLADLALAGGGHPRITTAYRDLRIPLTANGISATNPGEFQLDFWHGGTSTAYLDEIRFD